MENRSNHLLPNSNLTRLLPDYTFKVVLIGESGVGKTSIVNRLVKNTFRENHLTTDGVDFETKTIVIDGKRVKAQIWDIAGQERFKAITSNYYHQAHGAIVVYDITSESSFRQLKQWLKRLEQHSGNINLVVLLVGNKGDMEYNRVISINEAKNFAEENELLFMETSAKDNMNVELAFRTILKDLIEIQSNTDLSKQFLPINPEPPSPISEQTLFRLQNKKQGKKERKIFGFTKY